MDEEGEGWSGAGGGSSSGEHVRTIAALQRVQASQANYSHSSAQDISRPKLRDNRQAAAAAACLGTCFCCLLHSQSIASRSLVNQSAILWAAGRSHNLACFVGARCHRPDACYGAKHGQHRHTTKKETVFSRKSHIFWNSLSIGNTMVMDVMLWCVGQGCCSSTYHTFSRRLCSWMHTMWKLFWKLPAAVGWAPGASPTYGGYRSDPLLPAWS